MEDIALSKTTFKNNASFQVTASVGGASISPCGRDVALASSESLQILDLDNPNLAPRVLPYHAAGNVADVQWSPHAVREAWVVVATGSFATLWDVATSTPHKPVKRSLCGHDRAIADLNFAVFHPDVLATSGLDTSICLWDLREACVRPTGKLSDWFAGGYQVKWNRQVDNILASSHDNRLHIWDIRNGAQPLRTIDAHWNKIHGLDWNRDYKENILTCSLDHTIKLWNWARSPDPVGDSVGDPIDRVIRTPYPVWRARHTPFGFGIIAMAADEDQHLYLYDRRTKKLSDRDSAIESVHVFHGHSGRVQEFLWRYRGGVEDQHDYREFQLVSCGRDKKLCLHKLPTKTLAMVGFEKGARFEGSMLFTRKGAEYKTFRYESAASVSNDSAVKLLNETLKSRAGSVQALGPAVKGETFCDHLSLANLNQKLSRSGVSSNSPRSTVQNQTDDLPSYLQEGHAQFDCDEMYQEVTEAADRYDVVLEKVNIQKRSARFSLEGPWGIREAPVNVKIALKFPHSYPQSSPTFRLVASPLAYPGASTHLQRSATVIINRHSSLHRRCLEPLLEFVLGRGTLEQCTPAQVVNPTVLRDVTSFDAVEHPEICDRQPENMVPAEALEATDGMTSISEGQERLGLDDSMIDLPQPHNINVPASRTIGARFAPNGQLVCFFPADTTDAEPHRTPDEPDFRGKVPSLMGESLGYFDTDTRRIGSLSGSHSGSFTRQSSLSSPLTESLSNLRRSQTFRSSCASGRPPEGETNGKEVNRVGADGNEAFQDGYAKSGAAKRRSKVSLHSSHGLLLMDEELAHQYHMSGLSSKACVTNSQASKQQADIQGMAHYHRTTEMWRDAAVVARGPLRIGQEVVSQFLAELEAVGDVQNLATMTTVLAQNEVPLEDSRAGQAALDLGEDCVRQIESALAAEKEMASPTGVHMTLKNQGAFDTKRRLIPLLNPAERAKHNRWRQIYGEQLYSWKLYTARAEMMKVNGTDTGPSDGYRVSLEDEAKDPMPHCPLCWQQIRGTAAMCPACKHSLHLECNVKLGKECGTDLQCPQAGCGCHCLANGRPLGFSDNAVHGV